MSTPSSSAPLTLRGIDQTRSTRDGPASQEYTRRAKLYYEYADYVEKWRGASASDAVAHGCYHCALPLSAHAAKGKCLGEPTYFQYYGVDRARVLGRHVRHELYDEPLPRGWVPYQGGKL